MILHTKQTKEVEMKMTLPAVAILTAASPICAELFPSSEFVRTPRFAVSVSRRCGLSRSSSACGSILRE
jgi:hypothetical protein